MFPSSFYAFNLSLFHCSSLSSRPLFPNVMAQLIPTRVTISCHTCRYMSQPQLYSYCIATHLVVANSACSSWRQIWRRMLAT